MQTQLKKFLKMESASGIILFLATFFSLWWANSPVSTAYFAFTTSAQFIINDGLMAIFFLLVGLELKRGYYQGHLSNWSQIALPLTAAVGGMLIPACIYFYINSGNPEKLVGWAIPVATDIAFAAGVLSLFARRIPGALRLFLLALAIFDDIGAIVIIAFFYTQNLSLLYLSCALVFLLLMYLFRRFAINHVMAYLLAGAGLWFCLLKGGVHPTIGGVLTALMIPAGKPMQRLETTLHPWVAFVIMPLFALANAGFDFSGITAQSWSDSLTLGIILGLFFGKQIGVFGFSWLLIKLGLAKMPKEASFLQLYGVALLAGIGFTMSLFLGTLSFQYNNNLLSEMRLGVIVGSVLSGLIGSFVLWTVPASTSNRRSQIE